MKEHLYYSIKERERMLSFVKYHRSRVPFMLIEKEWKHKVVTDC